MFPTKLNCFGQSLLEVVLAMAIFALIATSLTALALGGFRSLEQGGEQTQAEALAQEGIEAVRAIKDRAWNENIYLKSAVEINIDKWVFSGEGTVETIGQFTRIISFSDVCRSQADEIVPCPGSYTDKHSKQVIVKVEWLVRPGIVNSVQKIAYLTNWDSQDWLEDLSVEFGDGEFNDTEVVSALGDGDGSIILQEL